ncbi:hypothetical protein U2T78_004319 [Providencia stuartii]|uniref:hypothetical protein n=1 Tax=Providencia stuartii TaxID=588 RepID=UPI00197F016E|nr:hypothetical protein [Providencia stuartii]ELR5120955.1 hypothetical protein [Providencia stuartii]EMA3643503.1 hypothetical protein [Providencia stuartii]EMF0919352.1 hypothetical protein [Providencia stuartii]MBN5557254.1 hypothetical protein [Providencia stuartii]MBQ0457528.1 hypothetical protein [Providencia stuartii]
MTDKTGGAAFPASGHPDMQFVAQEGMSLRDYFAAKAMQGDFAAQSDEFGNYYEFTDEQLDNIAKFYYRMADAMLKARG